MCRFGRILCKTNTRRSGGRDVALGGQAARSHRSCLAHDVPVRRAPAPIAPAIEAHASASFAAMLELRRRRSSARGTRPEID